MITKTTWYGVYDDVIDFLVNWDETFTTTDDWENMSPREVCIKHNVLSEIEVIENFLRNDPRNYVVIPIYVASKQQFVVVELL